MRRVLILNGKTLTAFTHIATAVLLSVCILMGCRSHQEKADVMPALKHLDMELRILHDVPASDTIYTADKERPYRSWQAFMGMCEKGDLKEATKHFLSEEGKDRIQEYVFQLDLRCRLYEQVIHPLLLTSMKKDKAESVYSRILEDELLMLSEADIRQRESKVIPLAKSGSDAGSQASLTLDLSKAIPVKDAVLGITTGSGQSYNVSQPTKATNGISTVLSRNN